MRSDPNLANLRKSPKFKPLLERCVGASGAGMPGVGRQPWWWRACQGCTAYDNARRYWCCPQLEAERHRHLTLLCVTPSLLHTDAPFSASLARRCSYDEPIINEGAIKALKSLFSFGKKDD